MSEKIVIIGAGISGLSAGCYACMNGYEAEVYEMHSKPGGLCTSWKRKGYTIDGCIHWLTGSGQKDSFYELWEEVGAVQGKYMINHDIFYRFTDLSKRTFIVYSNVDKLEAHMKEFSPEDSETIELLCRLIRKFTEFRMPMDKAFELYNFWDIMKMISKMRPVMKYFNFCNKTTVGEFAERFKDPLIRETLPKMIAHRDVPLLSLVITLALMHNKAGGIPEGGSLEFARGIEKRFLDLGGKIFYGERVGKILTDNGKASGIRLEGGKDISADYIISASDLKTTLYDMLEGKYIDPMHEELFSSVKLFPSSVQVSFGVNMDLSNEHNCLCECYKLNKPLIIGNRKHDWFTLKNYCYDPMLAPKGKSVLECIFSSDNFEYWQKLYSNKKACQIEKKRIAELVADELNCRYPGLKSQIEVVDVVTPMTYVRYTGNWKGTFMTWILNSENAKRFRLVKKTVPGLDNFWLSGMWIMPPGGLPTAIKTSRDIIQIICRQNRKHFRVEKPH